MKLKEPTCTLLVLEVMVKTDDFMSVSQIMKATGLTANRTTAALCHLRKRKAVDSLACDGSLWWFATPDSDNRCYCVKERMPEVNKRKPRKSRKVVAS